MSSFSVHITTDNAAFSDERPAAELARVLRTVADTLDRRRAAIDPDDHRHGANCGTVHDENGNAVGRWFWTDRSATHDDGAALDGIAQALRPEHPDGPERDHLAAVTQWLERAGREVAG